MKKIMIWLGALTKRAAVPAAKPTMSDDERNVIVEFAKGAFELRSKAIEIHRAYINSIGLRGDVFQCFMAEVDNPVPDYAQRHAYRDAVLSVAA